LAETTIYREPVELLLGCILTQDKLAIALGCTHILNLAKEVEPASAF
jgi:hypothetical protein